ncbi:MAG: DUF3347 domain-containing protein [Chitinophagaceae bacterium]|nr:DUF3347 domain-containing protein [Chitinophagaceae bacterium]
MKKILVLLLLVAVAFGIYWFKFRKTERNSGPKQQPLQVNKHSAAFNATMDSLINCYLNIKNSLVEADTAKTKTACRELIQLSDSSKFMELKKDTVGIFTSAVAQLDNIKSNAESLLKQSDITEIRRDFSMISESIYPLLKTIHYEGKTLFWQNCPMAFNDEEGANWINETSEIINPYLGKHHPTYKAAMLNCGDIKDSIK